MECARALGNVSRTAHRADNFSSKVFVQVSTQGLAKAGLVVDSSFRYRYCHYYQDAATFFHSSPYS